MVENYGLIPPC